MVLYTIPTRFKQKNIKFLLFVIYLLVILTIQTTHLGGSSSGTFDEYNISLFCVEGENLNEK
jgi:hypothetical protein